MMNTTSVVTIVRSRKTSLIEDVQIDGRSLVHLAPVVRVESEAEADSFPRVTITVEADLNTEYTE